MDPTKEGPALQVRTIYAAVGETIEIQWWRSCQGDPDRDPAAPLTQILIERHTAPPTETWTTRIAQQQTTQTPDQDPT